MKKILNTFFIIHFSFFIFPAVAAPDPNPIPRINVFSTSTDWEAITGLRLSQYDVTFTPDPALVGQKGLELYVMDGFPCYGQSDRTQIWFGPNNKTNGAISVICLYIPKTITFAWRNADRDALQDTTTGILECPTKDGNSFEIDMRKCTKGKDWKEYR